MRTSRSLTAAQPARACASLRRQHRYRLPMACLAAAVILAGCTTTDEIIIDRKGVDMARYAVDKAECEQYAREVRTGAKAARGAASGAVVGGAIGGITRDSSEGVARGAGVGAVTGTARGISEGERTKVRVVKQCLRGRGYRVLN